MLADMWDLASISAAAPSDAPGACRHVAARNMARGMSLVPGRIEGGGAEAIELLLCLLGAGSPKLKHASNQLYLGFVCGMECQTGNTYTYMQCMHTASQLAPLGALQWIPANRVARE
jgi:hypothetical protein